MQSSRFFEQEYLVDADVIHINLNIRVETTLTKTKKYKSIKSLIKSIKTFKLFKSFKSIVFINSFCLTFRLSLSINQVLITSQIIVFFASFDTRQYQTIDLLVKISRLRRSQTSISRRRCRSHRNLDIRVETTLKEREA